jgi:predicted transcriptional regulator
VLPAFGNGSTNDSTFSQTSDKAKTRSSSHEHKRAELRKILQQEGSMDDFIKQALDIVKAQASVRTMTEEEIASMVIKISQSIKDISTGNFTESISDEIPSDIDPKKAIREKSILCLECQKAFKVLTKKHLGTHGLTPEEYRAKYGYKKGTPLIAKGLSRDRRKKMQEMQLWKKKTKKI